MPAVTLIRKFPAIGLAVLILLACAHLGHYAEHLSVVTRDSIPCEGHGHDSGGPKTAEAGTSHGAADCCHSPAILEAAFVLAVCGAALEFFPTKESVPEAPVGEIDHPPQLS